MKSSLEVITRKVLPAIVSAAIAAAPFVPGISYGQKPFERSTVGVDEVDFKYRVEVQSGGKEFRVLQLDKDGNPTGQFYTKSKGGYECHGKCDAKFYSNQFYNKLVADFDNQAQIALKNYQSGKGAQPPAPVQSAPAPRTKQYGTGVPPLPKPVASEVPYSTGQPTNPATASASPTGQLGTGLPPLPSSRQVVPIAGAPAPADSTEDEKRLRAAAEQNLRDEQNKMLDIAEEKFRKEEAARRAKADADAKAALDKKEKEKAAALAAAGGAKSQIGAQTGGAQTGTGVTNAGESRAGVSTDSGAGKSIYDFAVGTARTENYSEKKLSLGMDYLSGKDRSVVQLGIGYRGIELALRGGSAKEQEVKKLNISAGSLNYDASDNLQDAKSVGVEVSYNPETERFTFHVGAAYDEWTWNRNIEEKLSNSSGQEITSKKNSKSYGKSATSVQLGVGFKPSENLELRILAEQSNFNFNNQLKEKGYKSSPVYGAGARWNF